MKQTLIFLFTIHSLSSFAQDKLAGKTTLLAKDYHAKKREIINDYVLAAWNKFNFCLGI